MMELRCVVVVTLVCSVAASPYGYGVKGGAAARAQSGASAGAFGGVGEPPAAIPFGPGFSGSFSKSSSSSSSSSSASSSSSSSSFSYGGSGAGFQGFGSNGASGCATGNCPSAGSNGIVEANGPSGTGGGPYGHSAANSAASAGAIAAANSGCEGSSCGFDTNKCTSGQCTPNTKPGSSSADSNPNDNIKCTSGQCGSTDGTSTIDNNNDIRVVSDKDKTTDTGSGCSSNNCGPLNPGSTKPTYSNSGINSYGSSNAVTAGNHKPASELESPKIDSNLPSSYNTPIHNTYNNVPSCDGGKCDNQPKGSQDTPTNYLTPPAITNPNSPNCEGPNCFGGSSSQSPHYSNTGANVPGNNGKPGFDKAPTYNGGFGGPAGVIKPNDFNAPTSPSNYPDFSTPTHDQPSSGSGCTSPSCAGYPTSTSVGRPTGFYGHQKPTEGVVNTNDKQPSYTGGFGGPSGVLKPNEHDNHKPESHINKSFIPTDDTHVTPSNVALTGCKSPNCNGYNPVTGSIPSASPGLNTYGNIKPSKENIPSYTGGFGGPGGILKPNEFDIHSPVSIGHGHPSSSSPHNTSPTSTNPLGPNAQGESFGVTKPIVGPHISTVAPSGYTGSYNHPSGITKPHEVNSAISSITPSYTQTPISTNTYSTGCKSGNCITNGAHSNSNLPSGSLDTGNKYPARPTGSYSAGCKTGNCGNFPTATSPNAANVPIGDVHAPNTGKYPTNTDCSTGNCGNYPGSYSTGCETGNCGDYPSSGPTFGAKVPSGSYNIGSPNNANYPAASAGCKTGNCAGYPTGDATAITNAPYGSPVFASPNTGKYPSTPSGSSTGCKTGNCGNYPTNAPINGNNNRPSGPDADNYPVSSGSYSKECQTGNCAPSNINVPSGPYDTLNEENATDCQSGNCGNYHNTHVANLPSGPYDSASNTGKYPAAPAGCKSGQCGNYPTASAPTGSFDKGPSHSTGCKNGDCGNYPTGGAAGSPQLGSFAHSKPNTPSKENLPPYAGGFGGPPGLLQPNEFTVPAGGITPNDHHKPTSSASKSTPCSSGNCNAQPSHDSSLAYNGANTVHAFAATSAKADAVAYTGGFGGPPGILKPYDDSKIGAALTNEHSPHDAHYGPGSAGHNAGSLGQSGFHGSNAAGSTAYSGAGAVSGYGGNGGYHNQGDNNKGSSPCSGGCGGSNGGPALAAAKSLSGASSFGYGGGFASSSASAHASAGAYTKGGYGRR